MNPLKLAPEYPSSSFLPAPGVSNLWDLVFVFVSQMHLSYLSFPPACCVVVFLQGCQLLGTGNEDSDKVTAAANIRLELSGPDSTGRYSCPPLKGGAWACLNGGVKSKELLHYCWRAAPPRALCVFRPKRIRVCLEVGWGNAPFPQTQQAITTEGGHRTSCEPPENRKLMIYLIFL